MCQIILVCSLHHIPESEEPTCNVLTPLTRLSLSILTRTQGSWDVTDLASEVVDKDIYNIYIFFLQVGKKKESNNNIDFFSV